MLMLSSFKWACLLVVLLLLDVLVVEIHCQDQDPGCSKKYRSGCPQSTFTASKVGVNWKCPSSWSRATFTSDRWNSTLLPVNTDNLTAEVVHRGNTTTFSLCSSTQAAGTEPGVWPAGGYCVPAPTSKHCPSDSMVRVSATVTAPGRLFTCPDMSTNPSPLSQCGNGTFKINACCPKIMSATEEYLDTPMFNIDTFHLLKTNDTCPKLYSFSSTEESVLLDQATISGPGKYFASTDNATLKISFCKYDYVSCLGRDQNQYETFVMRDPCKPLFTSYCKSPYQNQPSNSDSAAINYCLPSGNFSETSFCGAQCGPPPLFPNGTVTPHTNRTLATVTVVCDDGCFQEEGPESATCLINGTWSRDLSTVRCTHVQCSAGDLPQSNITQWTSDSSPQQFSYGHNVTVFCSPATTRPRDCYHLEEGEEVVEKVTITCQSDGAWSNQPACVIGTPCPVPANTSTATHLPWSPPLPVCEAGIDYTCLPHRLSLKDSLTVTCMSDGTWDNHPPNCETAFCDNPSLNISNGEVHVVMYNGSVASTYLEGDTLRYECDPTYRLLGDEVISCDSSGAWTGTVNNTCILIVCELAPLAIPHGYRIDALVNQSLYHLGDEVEYQCESEYELDNPDPVVCGNQALWNPAIPSCNLATCGRPPAVPHSLAPGTSFPLNHTYSYTCEEGYKIRGDNAVRCAFKGGVKGWQGTPPTCDVVHCGAVPNLTHGSYNSTPPVPSPYGTTTRYSCVEGYNASESYMTRCSGDETWRPAPACHPVRCLAPGVAYSVLNDSRGVFPFNSVISVRCDDSRVYHQPQVLICKDDGKWVDKLGGEITISCHGTPPDPVVGGNTRKWAYLGVGLTLLLLLLGFLLVFVIRKKRDARLEEPFNEAGSHHSAVNPGYKPGTEENELTGFSNPTYEDPEPSSFRIDRAASRSGRLVLRGVELEEAGYDTLRRGGAEGGTRRGAEGGAGRVLEGVSPEEGVYNVLQKVKPAEDETLRTAAKNDYAPNPAQIRDILVSPADINQGDDIYNVPTLGRNIKQQDDIYNVPTLGRNGPLSSDIRVVEVNDLYSSMEAAQICGTPLETDFDNIIYDNI